MTGNVRIYPDRQALIAGAETEIVAQLQAALIERQYATIALSGGSTPEPLYAALAGADLPWDRIKIFWGDERYVPPTHPDSNYGMTKRVWLDKIAIPAANVHSLPTELSPPETAAAAYEERLRAEFGAGAGEIPCFDTILLGMGDDGHTASLFPHTAALSVRDRLVTVGDKDGQPRLTFTIDLINRARQVIFLVAGASKQPALAAVFAPNGNVEDYPSRAIAPQGQLLWLLDAAAGEKLAPT
jgi:6-phosphogluconolactonase